MARSDKVRVCIIGAGSMAARVHYPSLARSSDVEIAAVGDLLEERLAVVGRDFQIPADRLHKLATPTAYRAMVEKAKPDGVYVIGQPHLMYDIWTWCLEQGLPLYIEKPMGLTLHQARMLAHLAEAKGVITQVSHQRRTSPLLVKMRQECLARGPITHAVCEFFKWNPEAMKGPRDRMMDDGVHSIDTVRWMCGGEVTEIHSHCRRIGTPDINWIGATLCFDNGAIGYLVLSFVSGRRVFRVQMHSPGIYTDAEVEAKAWLYVQGDYQGKVYDAKEVAGSDELYVYGGFLAKNREFIDSLKAGREMTSSPFRDCLKTMEVAEKILAQAALA